MRYPGHGSPWHWPCGTLQLLLFALGLLVVYYWTRLLKR